ncbi:MAG: putative sulfate exporter family transporter, partial [Ignavibacteria bacterium]
NPLDAFTIGEEKINEQKKIAEDNYKDAILIEENALQDALSAEELASSFNFSKRELNQAAVDAIDKWRSAVNKSSVLKKKAGVESFNQIPYLILLMIILAVFFGIGLKIMGKSLMRFIIGFLFVFLIAVISYAFANNITMNHYGLGYPGWAILFGLIISNTIGTPKWVQPAVQTEYYIKTGLVLLGAEILFGKILSIGVPGIFVAWVVTPVVLITTYWFGRKLIRFPSNTLNVTISAAVSVCGVSAAIATASACRAKKEELTLAVGLSLIFTAIMMILMPPFIKIVGMPYILGGAWMGGTIDATGAVAAAGAFLSDRALYVAATLKMIQNVLIGVIAFFVAIYWVAKVDRKEGQKVSAIEIWHRFPKFIIGFIAASILFSVIYQIIGSDMSYVVIDNGVIRGLSKTFRGWFFCLAFVSIGLATDFRQLKSHFKGGKPFILYVFGQTFNLILTLLMAYIMFYIVFPEITALI